MNDKVRCPNCLGNKTAMKLGNMRGPCGLCNATGFIEKPSPSTPDVVTTGFMQISSNVEPYPEKFGKEEPTKNIKDDIKNDNKMDKRKKKA